MPDDKITPNPNPQPPESQNPQPILPGQISHPASIPNTQSLPKQPTNLVEAVTEASIDRRTFIKWGAIGWAAFVAVVGGYGTMILRYLFPNVLFEPVQSFRAGYPEEYVVGDVSERWKDKFGVWIVRDEEKIYALSTVCTHLGCTPNWLPSDNKFKCPCHGSGFYKTGVHFEGPAPRPLERFKIYLADSGEIIVDKTRKFQQEKGEWKDQESFIAV